MKRFLSILILLFFAGTNSCLAYSELHYFKNIKTEEVEPVVYHNLEAQNFNVIKQNPYYAKSNNSNDTAVVIIQQSGDNMFYYYKSDKNTKVNKNILRDINKKGIVCEQSFNTAIISIYDNLAQNFIANSGVERQYNFDEAEDNIGDNQFFSPIESPQKQVQKPQTFSGYIAQISAGTKLSAYLQNSINTATASQGDRVVAFVSDNLMINNTVVIPQGSLIYGYLSKARNATYGSRNGRVVITFNKIVTPENKEFAITAETIDFTVSNEGKVSTAVQDTLTHAAAGAVVGLVFALLTGNSIGKSTAIGAGVGAGTTAIYSATERGVDAEIPSYTEMEVTLTSPINIGISM